MYPSPHVADTRTFGTSLTVMGVPSGTSSLFSLSNTKNAIDFPSGDQVTARAFSVPVIGRASTDESARIHTRRAPLASAATYASCDPSGDSAMHTVSTVSANAPPRGGAIANRADGDAGAAVSWRGRSHDPTATTIAIAATAHGRNFSTAALRAEWSTGDTRSAS